MPPMPAMLPMWRAAAKANLLRLTTDRERRYCFAVLIDTI
jgi:hypothetical protein